MQHSIDRLTTDWPNVSKRIWSTTTSQTPSQDSANSSKLLMLDTGNVKENSPAKPTLPALLETSQTTNLIPPNPITSLANPSPSRRTIPALPRARALLPTQRSPLLTFPQNSGKTAS